MLCLPKACSLIIIWLLPSLSLGSQLTKRSSRHALALRSTAESRAAAHRSAAKRRLLMLEHHRSGDVDTATLVTTLQEVVEGIMQEQDNGKKALADSKASCKETTKGLESAITEASRVADRTKDDVAALTAVAEDLEATIGSLKEQIEASSKELDKIQRRRLRLSKTYGEDQKRSQVSLQQLERVIEAVRGKLMPHPHKAEDEGRAFMGLSEEVSVLEQLRHGLVAGDTQQPSSAPAFLQMQREVTVAGKPGNRKLSKLEEDESKIVKASEGRAQEYRKQVNALADLQKDEEEELQKLEQELASQQTAAADKWQQVAEAKRTLANSHRSVQRDAEMLEQVEAKCARTAAFHEGQIDLRSAQSSLLSAAIKLLETMDVGMFIAKDMHALPGGGSLSFIQTAAEDDDSSSDEAGARASQMVGLLQDLSSDSAEEAASFGVSSGGPFDKVIGLMKSLIDSLRDQANEDTEQFQFCQNSIRQLRRQRLAKKAASDVQASEIRFAKVALARLSDQVDFLNSELQRLDDAIEKSKSEAEKETQEVTKQIQDHDLAMQIVSQVVTVLVQLCDLPEPGSSWNFIQGEAVANKSSTEVSDSARGSTCSEASGALQGALQKLSEQNKAANAYIKALDSQVKQAAKDATVNRNQRSLELSKAKSAQSNRNAELQKAKQDKKSSEEDLQLLEEQKKQLDKSCGPGSKESHSERMARRKDEIDALKSALSVLNGESLPEPA